MLSNLKKYAGTMQFTNRKGSPAGVDPNKPIQVIFDDPNQAVITIDPADITPTGNKGEYAFKAVTVDGASGGFSGVFRGDPDLSEAEGVVDIPFAEVVGEEGATGGSVSFGDGEDK